MGLQNWTSNFSEILTDILAAYDPTYCTAPEPTRATQIITSSVLMVWAFIGNLTVIATFCQKRIVRSTTNHFIANMALSDLIIAVICMPVEISFTYHGGWVIDGVAGDLFCKVSSMAWLLSIIVSMLTMIAVAVDRFYAMAFPMRRGLISVTVCRVMILASWVIAIALNFIFLYACKVISHNDKLFCVLQFETPSETYRIRQLTWVVFFCFSTISAAILIILSSLTIKFLYKQQTVLVLADEVMRQRHERNRKISTMLVIVIFCFCLVWAPFNIGTLISLLNPERMFTCFFLWFGMWSFPSFYSAINPVIYGIFNKNYRKGFKEIILYLLTCNRFSTSTVAPVITTESSRS